MPVVAIPLRKMGLRTIEEFAAIHGRGVRAVQRWIADGQIPAVVLGSGNRTLYLVRAEDATGFVPPVNGRPMKPKPVIVKPKSKGRNATAKNIS